MGYLFKEWPTKDGNKYTTNYDHPITFWVIQAEYAKPAWKPEEPIPDGACYPIYDNTPIDIPHYILGLYSSEDDNYEEKNERDDDWDKFLQDEAVRLAEEKGLDPEYTRLFILTSSNDLYGGSYPKKVG
jgi:hypothetical protein